MGNPQSILKPDQEFCTMKKLIPILIIGFALQSCKNKTTKTIPAETPAKDTLASTADVEQRIIYPKTGRKAIDFLPNAYEIQYEAEGDLNGDSLPDIAVVLKHKNLKTRQRPVLVLLQNEDQSFRLDKVSDIAMPIEYNEFDFKLYDTENISIENGALNIKLYGKDNAFGTFRYFGNDLLLTVIEVYYRGAGEQEGIKYDLVTGEQSTTRTEFLSGEDDPKVTESTDQVKTERRLFENTSITAYF